MEKKEKKASLLEALRSNFYMIGLAFTASPSRVIGEFALGICQNLQRLFFGIVFWEVILGFVEREASFKEVIPFLVFTVAFEFGPVFYRLLFFNVIQPCANHKMYEKLHMRMFEKATDVELECFENPDFYNKYMKATTQIKSRAHTVLWVTSYLIASLLSLGYLFYKTVRIDPFGVLLAVFPMISTDVIGKRINRVNY